MTAVLLPNSTHAYFQSKGEERDFLRAGYKVNWNKDENTFALYDDFNPGRIDNDQILFPKSKFFVSADLISIAFPLPIVFYYYTTTENALADLLYVNLKMKKLIEEYEDIQERSKKLIWDSQYLFQQRDTTGSIYQITRRLKESSIKTTGDIVSLSFKTHVLVSNRVRSFRPLFERNKRLRPNFNLTVNRTNVNNNRTVRGHSYEDQDEVKHYEEETRLSKKVTGNPYRKVSDPLIIRLLAKLPNIIRYLIANKGEAVFYGIGLILTFLFFSSIFKR